MTGKGKGKGRGKGKDKIKRTETRFEGKIIDLPRFAYDVFVRSALKFGVPAHCIPKWTKGGENDYGYPNFIYVLSSDIAIKQLLFRHELYADFKRHYDSNSFESFQNIPCLLHQLLKHPTPEDSDVSYIWAIDWLGIINEFVLFLYSENCNLFLNELAVLWFKHLGVMKERLEKERGLALIYEGRDRSLEAFYDGIILKYYIPYNGSVDQSETYLMEHKKLIAKRRETALGATGGSIADSASGIDLPGNTLVPRMPEEMQGRIDEITERMTHRMFNILSGRAQSSGTDVSRQTRKKGGQKDDSDLRSPASFPPVTSDRDEASGCDIPINTGLGIPPHEEFYKVDITGRAVEGASAQDTPSASCRKSGKTPKRASRKRSEQKNVSEPRSQVSSSSATSVRDESSATDKPLNTGLGMPQHESLRGDGASRADDSTSP